MIFIIPNLSWQVGNGSHIFLGIDMFAGMGEHFALYDQLNGVLQEKNIYDLKHIYFSKDVDRHGWLS